MFRKIQEWHIRHKFIKIYNAALEDTYEALERNGNEYSVNAFKFYPLFKKYKFKISEADILYCLQRIMDLMKEEFGYLGYYVSRMSLFVMVIRREMESPFPEFETKGEEI